MRPSSTKIDLLRNHCSPDEQFDGLVELFIDCLRNMHSDRLHYSSITAFLYALSKSDIPYIVEYIIHSKSYNAPQPVKRTAEIVLLYFLLYFVAVSGTGQNSKSLRDTIPIWLQPLADVIRSDKRITKRGRGVKSCEVLLDVLSEHMPELLDEYPWLKSVIDLLKQILQSQSIDAIFDLPNI